jgi:hypothetical protein
MAAYAGRVISQANPYAVHAADPIVSGSVKDEWRTACGLRLVAPFEPEADEQDVTCGKCRQLLDLGGREGE